MGGDHIVALTVFASYFLIIIGLFAFILRSLGNWRLPQRTDRQITTCWIFAFLTLASLAHTWLHMFRFLAWSFNTYESNLPSGSPRPVLTRLTSWLIDTSLFEQAWAAVCFGPFNWWWSQQLCLYTVGAWTVFLATKGPERRVRHVWAYMLLGQLVAISVASNLFYLALLLRAPSPVPASDGGKQPPKSTKSKPPRASVSVSPTLYAPVLLAFATIFYSPYTSVASGTFLPNLLLMHSLIFIPLVLPPSSSSLSLPKITLRTFALLLSAASLLLHANATLRALASLQTPDTGTPGRLSPWDLRAFGAAAWDTLQAHHPAQSSIGWDVVWTNVSFVLWTALSGESEEGMPVRKSGSHGAAPGWGRRAFMLPLALATPLVSVGAVAPWVFSERGEFGTAEAAEKEE
ncbi:hypothetical protein LshimejAT787_0506430 [Lyophyllum shimeji]|uniref:Uncharacterized protein n=1 Tax=Lyophyllum shimeji TaxID=47721 RepID=A0A9P3PNP4_LYOSH|nr:hypothetical protein LshimejAT787_0506430 [Lyophyllum shimeji]